MADSTLRLTFLNMQVRVAEYLGLASYSGGAAAVPTSAHDLDLVKRLVNDGYRRFISENPNWNFLSVPLSLTFVAGYEGTATDGTSTTLVDSSIAGVYADDFFTGMTVRVVDATDGDAGVVAISDFVGATGTFTFTALAFTVAAGDTYEVAHTDAVEGQNYRYYLPDDFYGILLTPFTYPSSGPRRRIGPVQEHTIRELRAVGSTTGDPSMVAFRPINTTAASTGKRWEAIFWPTPSGTHTVTAQYRRFPNALSSDTDASVAGYQHDRTVLNAAMASAELERDDEIDNREKAYQSDLERSLRLDAKATPSRAQSYGDRSEDYTSGRPSSYFQVDSYNDVSID